MANILRNFLFKRFQAKLFPASFVKFLVYEYYPFGYCSHIGVYKDAIFESPPEIGNDNIDIPGDEKRIRLRKRYDVVTFANNSYRETFLSDCTDYITNQIFMKPTKARVYIELLLKQYARMLFPPLPPIEYFRDSDSQKSGYGRDSISKYDLYCFDDYHHIKEVFHGKLYSSQPMLKGIRCSPRLGL